MWIIAFLPVGGLFIGLSYHLFGSSVVKGNNLLLEEFHSPKKIIPLRMAPLVLFGTIATHFFGGSAGREGTAVQIGGAVADRFTKVLKLSDRDRRIVLIAGISAGFASVFGTPLAGAIFALEVLVLGRIRLDAIIPSFMAAILADYFCTVWGITHTQYHITNVAAMTPINLLWCLLAGIIFGLVAVLFSKSTHFWSGLFNSKIKYPPLRPVIGGAVLALVVYLMGTTKYIGLGVPTIVDAFNIDMKSYDFLLKVLFTSFTLGAGFKGGEVTPLFFYRGYFGQCLNMVYSFTNESTCRNGLCSSFCRSYKYTYCLYYYGSRTFWNRIRSFYCAGLRNSLSVFWSYRYLFFSNYRKTKTHFISE